MSAIMKRRAAASTAVLAVLGVVAAVLFAGGPVSAQGMPVASATGGAVLGETAGQSSRETTSTTTPPSASSSSAAPETAAPEQSAPVTTSPDAPETTTSEQSASATTTSGADAGCQDGQPCWNSCTMGKDGRFPVGDPRRDVAGPCDMFANLPDGKRFAVEVPPGQSTACGGEAGMFLVRAAVRVHSASGAVVAWGMTEQGCVSRDNPLGGPMPALLEPVFRQLAATL